MCLFRGAMNTLEGIFKGKSLGEFRIGEEGQNHAICVAKRIAIVAPTKLSSYASVVANKKPCV